MTGILTPDERGGVSAPTSAAQLDLHGSDRNRLMGKLSTFLFVALFAALVPVYMFAHMHDKSMIFMAQVICVVLAGCGLLSWPYFEKN